MQATGRPRRASWRYRRSAVVAASALAAGALAVPALAGGEAAAAPSTRAHTALVTVNVGALPIADFAPLFVGIRHNFFRAEGLNVVTHPLESGAAVVSAVLGGSLQFGTGAVVNLVLAREHGLPVEFVANGDEAAATAAKAWSAILVGKGSKIHSIKQLAGKTIAANAIEGANELAIDAVLLKNHVNPSSVHVVAMPFPSMPAALASGQVDAVSTSEPFVSAIKASGGRVLSPLFEGEQPGMMVAGYFTSLSEIKSDPSVVRKFAAAMDKALAYSASHSAAVRALVPTFTSIPAAAAKHMNLPVWSPSIRTGTVAGIEHLMVKLGWMKGSVPIDELVWSGARG